MSDLITLDTGATFSACQRYRYTLWRTWAAGTSAQEIAFIGLNPSTADAQINDPTVTRCINRAQRLGFSKMWMLNAFAYRATNPRDMLAQDDPVGPDNLRAIREIVERPEVTSVVPCWGVHGGYRRQDERVIEILAGVLTKVRVLGTTLEGFPRHPLYISNSTPLRPWVQLVEQLSVRP